MGELSTTIVAAEPSDENGGNKNSRKRPFADDPDAEALLLLDPSTKAKESKQEAAPTLPATSPTTTKSSPLAVEPSPSSPATPAPGNEAGLLLLDDSSLDIEMTVTDVARGGNKATDGEGDDRDDGDKKEVIANSTKRPSTLDESVIHIDTVVNSNNQCPGPCFLKKNKSTERDSAADVLSDLLQRMVEINEFEGPKSTTSSSSSNRKESSKSSPVFIKEQQVNVVERVMKDLSIVIEPLKLLTSDNNRGKAKGVSIDDDDDDDEITVVDENNNNSAGGMPVDKGKQQPQQPPEPRAVSPEDGIEFIQETKTKIDDMIQEMAAAMKTKLRNLKNDEDKAWLKTHQESMQEELFFELKDYIIVDRNGKLCSLMDVSVKKGTGPGALPPEHFIHGHLYMTSLSPDVKPLEKNAGYIGTLSLEISLWGIWWVDPRPILYVSVIDKEFGLDVTLELHSPHQFYRQNEKLSKFAELRRLMDISDIVLFEFVEKHPQADFREEEKKAREQAENDGIIVIGEEDEEDTKDVSLHRLLVERYGLSIWDIKKDQSAKDFMARQLDAENMKVFYQTPLIQQLLNRDSEGMPVDASTFDTLPPWRQNVAQLAPAHPLVVTPRVKQTLLRCMMDLLGEHAVGHQLYIPIVKESKNGQAEKMKGASMGVRVTNKENSVSIQFQSVRLLYRRGKHFAVKIGDFVRTLDPDKVQFLKVLRIWKSDKGKWKCHGLTLRTMDNTVIGIGGMPNELCFTGYCTTINMKFIEEVVKVRCEPEPTFEEWRALAASKPVAQLSEYDSYTLKYRYTDNNRCLTFTYLSEDELRDFNCYPNSPIVCRNCVMVQKIKQNRIPKVSADDGALEIGGEKIEIGQCMYFVPDTLPLKHQRDRSNREEKISIAKEVAKYVDHPERAYPESRHYQKKLEKGELRKNEIEPFMIGKLDSIVKGKDGSPQFLIMQPFYRGSDIDLGSVEENWKASGSLELFMSEEKVPVSLQRWPAIFRGKCFVLVTGDQEEGEAWVAKGQNRFYAYRKVLGEGKEGVRPLSNREWDEYEKSSQNAPEYLFNESSSNILHSLELFCGGGGSSCGLHQAGIKTKVAIDMDVDAKETMKRNNKHATVVQMDVNEFLQKSMNKEDNMPRTGDFDVIFGGPPCQGFSLMNRNQNSANSKKKNTCVTTQMSFYDYFRPRYCVLENVHGILNMREDAASGDKTRKTSTCSVIVSVMLDLGFQVSLYQLNAGAFGVPQCRNRVFVVGAAPQQNLPEVPKPIYCSQLPPVVLTGLGKQLMIRNTEKVYPGPLPELTVYDAISDLPSTRAGTYLPRVKYGGPPNTSYQRQMRGNLKEVANHESRSLSVMDRIRVEHLPKSSVFLPEPDWRLLPNIDYEDLATGASIRKMNYQQEGTDPKVFRYKCPTCPDDLKAFRKYNRKKTRIECSIPGNCIIPGTMAHKSILNSWNDCYGRVSYHLWFKTITTGDALGQQSGRILHPEQDRILTVRELARGQGFPDHWHFEGRISAKNRQIGNAVPPPLTRAIGLTIRSAYEKALKRTTTTTTSNDDDTNDKKITK